MSIFIFFKISDFIKSSISMPSSKNDVLFYSKGKNGAHWKNGTR
ncbi:hypothetical protein DJ66_0072 [Candidatus Liberibacter solanacearum]|uniref:Uncharacterized protein n=1 Tax=Candidatus Liberibacter solanacearum TaxID=556287 RepID=A0A0F4VMF6_9HYPH|nr:hypothetical protein DJ66_0072 [Candidatus Liberibacter solanacearum]